MMKEIKTKINGKVAIDMWHGFDCVVRGQVVENFRTYEAAREFQKIHNAKSDAIAKENIGKPKKECKPVPPLCSIQYYVA